MKSFNLFQEWKFFFGEIVALGYFLWGTFPQGPTSMPWKKLIFPQEKMIDVAPLGFPHEEN